MFDTPWNYPDTFSRHTMHLQFSLVITFSLAKRYRIVQVVHATDVTIVFNQIKKNHNTRVQSRKSCLLVLYICRVVSKEELEAEPIFTKCIHLKTIPFGFVCYPFLVCMHALKANCRLINFETNSMKPN